MEAITYIISIGAGAFYLLASYRLLKLSHQTRERPEFWLGTYFAATGQWYLIYNAPYFLGYEELPVLVDQGIEWIYAIGVAAYLLFVRGTFRPRSRWALALVILAVFCSLSGAIAASLRGSFSNMIDDPAYRIEWVGYTIPFGWAAIEAFQQYRQARRRVSIGVCEPSVCNRMFLWSMFGAIQFSSCVIVLGQYAAYERENVFTSTWDLLYSSATLAALIVICLAFFPPRVYVRWINAASDEKVPTSDRSH